MIKLNFDYVASVARGSFSLPKRATKHSAGYDLFCPTPMSIPPSSNAFINLGIWWNPQTEPTVQFFAKIFDKSGLALKQAFSSIAGVIDMDYNKPTDSWGLICRNDSAQWISFEAGQKIAQFVLLPFLVADDCLNEAIVERDGGYGSTGK